MPAFSTRYIDEERARLRQEGSLARSGTIDRSGDPNHPALAAAAPAAGGALSNAAPPPPTGQGTEGYPPASPTQASSQVAGAAPFNPSRQSALAGQGGTYKPGNPVKKADPVNTTRQLFADSDPLAIEDALEASVAATENTAKGNPEAFKQIDAALTLKGIDTKTAFYDLRDSMMEDAAKRKSGRASKTYNETEFKKRWKNIFNIIPEDRMGMFLFDFGLRMLGNSAQGGGAGVHVGQAGHGALSAMKGEMALGEQQALEAEKTAGEQAGALVGMEQQQQQIGIQGRQADTAEQSRIDEGAYRTEANRLKGKEIEVDMYRARNGLGSDGRPTEYESDRRYARMKATGKYSEERMVDIIEGGKTDSELRAMGRNDFNDALRQGASEIPPGGTTKKALNKFTPQERRKWIDEYVSDALPEDGGGGALRSPTAPKRPDAMNDPRYK